MIEKFCLNKEHNNMKNILAEPITELGNHSMNEGYFPDLYKSSHVIPGKKPGKSKSKAASFRPISLTCHIGKILERIVQIEVVTYLEEMAIQLD